MAKKKQPKARKPRKLTAKQAKYLNNRISGMGVSESYRDAYDCEKMSDKSVSVAANVLEQDPRFSVEIEAAAEKAKQEAIKGAVMTRQEALEHATRRATANISDFLEFEEVEVETKQGVKKQTIWRLKKQGDLPPEIAACIKSITFTKNGPKIELHDQAKAIDQIRAMEGFDQPKKKEISGLDGKPIAIQADVSAPEIVEAVKGIIEHL